MDFFKNHGFIPSVATFLQTQPKTRMFCSETPVTDGFTVSQKCTKLVTLYIICESIRAMYVIITTFYLFFV